MSNILYSYSLYADGIPCCPHDETLPMKHAGTSKRKKGVVRSKFICPKVKYEKNPATDKYTRVCHCDNPCTTSTCGRMVYIYPEKDLRAYPGTFRGPEDRDNTYKIQHYEYIRSLKPLIANLK